ncbi:thiamine pyrophosphate-binding protein [Kitasatospora sp. NPDC018058]|uniref:thiamine pyrophosphate-binding protein n=1 Tax=Kitasatospora sp. NPDC018058 TaxID=3364025 RepID=UPI0037BF0F64
MSPKVSDHILERLRVWDVEYVFGYLGDGINGLLSAWGRAENHPAFVQARHEEMAAFEAVGYTKFSGRTGVCAATSGPGAIHLLNGLHDAKLDHVPVTALVGQTDRSAMSGSYQQEVDLLSLFKDVAAEYCQMVTVPEQLPNVLDRALRTAAARRTVTAVIVPADVQELDYSPPEHAFKMVPSNNRDLNQVTWEMRAMQGAPSFLPSQELPDVDYAAFARTLDLAAARAIAPEDVSSGWQHALDADRPFLLELRTDPAVPPIPPHASWDQIQAAAASVLRGDNDRPAMVRQGFKAKLQELLPSFGGRHGRH